MLEKSTNWTKTYKLLCQKWDKTPTNLRAADFPPLVVRASSNRAPTAFLLYEVASAVGAIEFVIRVGRPGSGCEALFGQRAGINPPFRPSTGEIIPLVMEAADSGLEHVRLLTTAQADDGGEERLYDHAQRPVYYFKRHQFYLQSRAEQT